MSMPLDYLQRLIHRALALPRDHAAPLFDPFEQTAEWEGMTPSTLRPAEAAATPEAVNRDVPMRADATANESVRRMPERARNAARSEPAAPPRETLVKVRARSEPPSHESARHAEPMRSDSPIAQPAPLASADTFMRSIGAKLPSDDPGAQLRQCPTQHAPALVSPLVPRSEPVDQRSESSQLLRAVAPRASVPAASVPANSRRASKQPPPLPVTPSPAHVPRTSMTPERTVHTTVVVAPSPSSHRLDDLAHSAHLTRFGIGQG